MIEALENMRRYYNDRSVEPFKDFISVPGIAGIHHGLCEHMFISSVHEGYLQLSSNYH